MRIRTVAILAILFASMPQFAFASELSGIWATSGGRSHVEVKPCDQYVCANIIWLQNPTKANGEPLYDRRNEVVELRDRPIMGILILKVAKVKNNLWKGRVYDPERGSTYPAEVNFVKRGVLKVTGCGLGGLVCKSKNWTKISDFKDPAPRQIEARSDAVPLKPVVKKRQRQAPPTSSSLGSGLKPYPPR